MATLTSTHQGFGSGSLTVAPTENTAPVHEFRCLYTRDLHKKSKKWHDGTVKFHTFNRRVMVYDDARNFIGDLHYRPEEEFGEGTEIRLDRGIFVGVEERLGETETDVSLILDRQRPEKASSPRGQPVSLSSRSQSTSRSQRPKSLLEVLGPSQGRFGRARRPYQSPYEQINNSTRTEVAGPPQKRQRLSSEQENHTDHVLASARAASSRLPQPVQASKLARQPPCWEEPPMEFEEFLDLSSGEELRRLPPQRTVLTGRATEKTISTPNKQTRTSNSPSSRPSAQPQLRVRGPAIGKVPRQTTKHFSEPAKSLKETPPSTSRLPANGTGRLLLSQPKTRNKLVCLLPYSTSTSIARPPGVQQQTLPRRRDITRSPSSGAGRAVLLHGRLRTAADVATRPVVVPRSNQSTTENAKHVSAETSSPLFMPEDITMPMASASRLLSTQNGFPPLAFVGGEKFESPEKIRKSQPAPAQEAQFSPKEPSGAAAYPVIDAWDPDVHVGPVAPPESEPGQAFNECAQMRIPQLPLSIEPRPSMEEPISPKRRPHAGMIPQSGNHFQPGRSFEAEKNSGRKEHVQLESLEQLNRQGDAEAGVEPERRVSMISGPFLGNSSPRVINKGQPAVLDSRKLVDGQAVVADGRLFRRVFSESDAPEDSDLTMAAEPPALQARSPLQLLENLSSRRTPAKVEGPAKLQRCASETFAQQTANTSMERSAEETSKEPTGPWTVHEAFLLFDWWPADIEKPACWAATMKEPPRRIVPELGQPLSTGITTARQFLRDDINAL